MNNYIVISVKIIKLLLRCIVEVFDLIGDVNKDFFKEMIFEV